MKTESTGAYKSESKFQTDVLKLLESIGGYWIKIHVGAYQKKGEPDIVGCYKGKFYALELKQGKNKPSPLQEYKLNLIRKSGGKSMAIYSLEDVRELFKNDDIS